MQDEPELYAMNQPKSRGNRIMGGIFVLCLVVAWGLRMHRKAAGSAPPEETPSADTAGLPAKPSPPKVPVERVSEPSRSRTSTEQTPAPSLIVPPSAIEKAAPPHEEEPAVSEKRVKVTWDAKAMRVDENAVPPGTRCTVDATIATADEVRLHLVDIVVRCGRSVRYESAGLAPNAKMIVKELPGLKQGTYVYTLQYEDALASIDTVNGRATIDTSTTLSSTLQLVVANESKPVPEKLLLSTPTTRVILAGTYAGPEDAR